MDEQQKRKENTKKFCWDSGASLGSFILRRHLRSVGLPQLSNIGWQAPQQMQGSSSAQKKRPRCAVVLTNRRLQSTPKVRSGFFLRPWGCPPPQIRPSKVYFPKTSRHFSPNPYQGLWPRTRGVFRVKKQPICRCMFAASICGSDPLAGRHLEKNGEKICWKRSPAVLVNLWR